MKKLSEMSDPDNKLDKWKKAFYLFMKKAKQYAREKDKNLYDKAVENAKYYNEKYKNQTSIDLYHLGSKTSMNEMSGTGGGASFNPGSGEQYMSKRGFGAPVNRRKLNTFGRSKKRKKNPYKLSSIMQEIFKK